MPTQGSLNIDLTKCAVANGDRLCCHIGNLCINNGSKENLFLCSTWHKYSFISEHLYWPSPSLKRPVTSSLKANGCDQSS